MRLLDTDIRFLKLCNVNRWKLKCENEDLKVWLEFQNTTLHHHKVDHQKEEWEDEGA